MSPFGILNFLCLEWVSLMQTTRILSMELRRGGCIFSTSRFISIQASFGLLEFGDMVYRKAQTNMLGGEEVRFSMVGKKRDLVMTESIGTWAGGRGRSPGRWAAGRRH